MRSPVSREEPSRASSRHDSEFEELWKSVEQSDDYWAALAVTDFTAAISRLLRERNLSRATFASKLGKKPSWVSRVLNGSENLNVKTMVQMARALGLRLRLSLQDEAAQVEGQSLVATRNFHVVDAIDVDLLDYYLEWPRDQAHSNVAAWLLGAEARNWKVAEEVDEEYQWNLVSLDPSRASQKRSWALDQSEDFRQSA